MKPVFVVYFLVLLAGVIHGIYSYRIISKPFRVLCVLMFVTLFSESVAITFGYLRSNNSIVYHFFTPVQFFFIAQVYYYYFNYDKKIRRIFWFSTILLAAFAVFNVLYLSSPNEFPSFVLELEGVLILVIVLYSFLLMVKNPEELALGRQGIFWVSIGLLLFQCLTFIVWSLHQIMFGQEMISYITSRIRWGANYYLYICFFIALAVESRRNKSQQDREKTLHSDNYV